MMDMVTEVITIHPEEEMNVCTHFHGNPIDISLETTNVNLVVALESKSADHSLHPLNCTNVQNLTAWSDWPIQATDQHCHPYSHPTNVAKVNLKHEFKRSSKARGSKITEQTSKTIERIHENVLKQWQKRVTRWVLLRCLRWLFWT